MRPPRYGELQSHGEAGRGEVGRLWRTRDEEPDPCLVPTPDSPEPVTWADVFSVDYARRFVDATLRDRAACLPNREKQVIVMRFWHDRTFEEIASTLGVTKERVRQIEARALRRLRGRGYRRDLGDPPWALDRYLRPVDDPPELDEPEPKPKAASDPAPFKFLVFDLPGGIHLLPADQL